MFGFIASFVWLACITTAHAFIDFTANSPLNNLGSVDDVAPLYMGQDPESGCICRQKPLKMVVCFGGNVCNRFPKSVNVPTAMLRVKTSNIHSIKTGDLQRMIHLRYLEIEANHNLRYVQSGTFLNMSALVYLSLSFNNRITHLDENTFDGLLNLQYLKMIKNGFNRVIGVTVALAPRSLPALLRLDLSENYLSNISRYDFEPMRGTQLIELNLVLCQLEYIHPMSLIHFKKLAELRIGENALNSSSIAQTVYQCIINNIPLTTLNLFGMGFRKTPPTDILSVLAESNVTQLVLAKNQFEYLPGNSFALMPQLKFLDLRQVLAVGIDDNALGAENLPSLQTLLLSGNKFSKVPRGALLPQLRSLDLSANSGIDVHSTYFELEENMFQNMSELLTLNLSFNKITTLYNTTFVGLNSLKVLSLKNATIFHIDPNSFEPLNNLEFLNMENNLFPRNTNLSKEQFIGLENLRVLLFGSCSIKTFQTVPDFFTVFPNLTRLSLRDNELTVLPQDIFKPLIYLEALDLSDNKLITWRETTFSVYNKYLVKLILTGNKIAYLSDGMLKDFFLVLKSDTNETELQIEGNPLICDCQSFKAVEKFVHEHNATVIDVYLADSLAICTSPDEWTDKTVAEFWSTFTPLVNCPYFSQLYFTFKSVKIVMILPLFISLTIVIFVGSIAFKYRWYIRYWMFLGKIGLGRRRISLCATETKEYQYDAFVSYSSEDADFVINLVSVLEECEHPFKLCVYERDFEIGDVITEAVTKNMTQSRHIILVLSNSFAKSQWCRWETQLAEHQRVFFENSAKYDPLILIKLGSIKDTYLTPTLKYLLKTKVYLEWNVDIKKSVEFWARLKWALKRSRT